MTEIFESLRTPVERMIEPSRAQIIRAKNIILSRLTSGETYVAPALVDEVLIKVGEPLNLSEEAEKITLGSPTDAVPDNSPAVTRRSWALAAMHACAELSALGITLPMQQASATSSHSQVINAFGIIPCSVGNTGSAIRPQNSLPALAPAYRLATSLLEQDESWFTDPDVFLQDLKRLQMDRRTRRTLTEALTAYRHGLYLAACNLLGGAVEGAWYSAGEQLRDLDSGLAKALDDDRTEAVIRRVADLIRGIKGRSPSGDELSAHAAAMREIRNYGVHPRPKEKLRLERHFTETSAAVLILHTHSHLSQLGEAVEQLVPRRRRASRTSP